MVKTKNCCRDILKCKTKTKNHTPKNKQSVIKYVKTLKDVVQKGKWKHLQELPCGNVKPVGSRIDNNNTNNSSDEKSIIIIDGNNVAFTYSNNTKFLPEGIDIAARFFNKKGHEIKVVVPAYRAKPQDSDIIERLREENKLLLSDSSSHSGTSLFIMDMAILHDGAVISNDTFSRLIHKSDSHRKIIENRVIGFIFCKEMFMVPLDPYGRVGPTLDQILNKRV